MCPGNVLGGTDVQHRVVRRRDVSSTYPWKGFRTAKLVATTRVAEHDCRTLTLLLHTAMGPGNVLGGADAQFCCDCWRGVSCTHPLLEGHIALLRIAIRRSVHMFRASLKKYIMLGMCCGIEDKQTSHRCLIG